MGQFSSFEGFFQDQYVTNVERQGKIKAEKWFLQLVAFHFSPVTSHLFRLSKTAAWKWHLWFYLPTYTLIYCVFLGLELLFGWFVLHLQSSYTFGWIRLSMRGCASYLLANQSKVMSHVTVDRLWVGPSCQASSICNLKVPRHEE